MEFTARGGAMETTFHPRGTPDRNDHDRREGREGRVPPKVKGFEGG